MRSVLASSSWLVKNYCLQLVLTLNEGESAYFETTVGGYALMVKQSDTRESEGWTERDFELEESRPDGTKRTSKVRQYHFTSWPDRGLANFNLTR